MKALLLAIARFLSVPYGWIPSRLRHHAIFGLFLLEGRASEPSNGLRNLFRLWDKLDLAINERAMALGRGEHPKHRLTRYHDFFTSHLSRTARVLDIGCGYGAVAASIARDSADRRVTGIDIDAANIAQALGNHGQPNLTFAAADARAGLPAGPWDAVVLSNILEHIDDRVQFLHDVIRRAEPSQVLVRVPLFERHWHMPMRAELGVSYRSDPDHRIEHRLSEFVGEVTAAGLRINDLQTLWGEIWCACSVSSAARVDQSDAA